MADFAEAKSHDLVLIVDDDRLIRCKMRDVLEQAGYEVAEAEDGNNCLVAFERLRPDIVLLDIIMPGLDGFAICAALRRLPSGMHTPILMTTGLDDVESINHAYQAGATNFITKPINWSNLAFQVSYMLRSGRLFDQLRRSEARLARSQQIARLGHWDWDLNSRELTCSAGVYRILGRESSPPLSYEAFLEAIYPEDQLLFVTTVNEAIATATHYSLEHRIVLPDGQLRYVHQQAEVCCDDTGRVCSLSGTIQDINERREAENRITQLAYHDNLTSLPNRYLLKDRLGQALKRAQRNGRMVATLFLDLDRFKRINDTLGHSIGDQLLKEVAGRLAESLRQTDTVAYLDINGAAITLARLGGDEFSILLGDLVRVQDVVKVARRILDIVSLPFMLGGHEVFVTASVGVSLYPMDGDNPDTLLKNADTALDFAKRQGRNNWQFYTESMNARALERLVLESNMLKALERQEFVLYYQPQLDLRSGAIIGMEGLARWQHPEQGLLYPAHFIPLADETGLIVPLVEWSIRTACRQSHVWQEAGLKPLRTAINLPSRHFMRQDLKETIARILDETGYDPCYLELEITEETIMQNEEQSIATLRQLKDMGVQISIDDFGTGYSSLSYLKRFPLDELKIDRSFLQGIPADQDNAAITRAIVAMAHSLKLRVVAEGVETMEQLAFLQEIGCDEMQGFLFSRAVPAEEFQLIMREGKGLRGL